MIHDGPLCRDYICLSTISGRTKRLGLCQRHGTRVDTCIMLILPSRLKVAMIGLLALTNSPFILLEGFVGDGEFR